MSNKNKTSEKFFIVFGGIVVLSGVYMAVQGDYVTGISGAIVGVFVAWMNLKTLKD